MQDETQSITKNGNIRKKRVHVVEYKCRWCSRVFQRRDALIRHEDTHERNDETTTQKETTPVDDFVVMFSDGEVSDYPEASDIAEFIRDELDSDSDSDSFGANSDGSESNDEQPEDSEPPPPAYTIADVIAPDKGDLPETLFGWLESADDLPGLAGHKDRVNTHKEMYLDLIERTQIVKIERLPIMSYKLTDRIALISLTAVDLTKTFATNMFGSWFGSEDTSSISVTEIQDAISRLTGKSCAPPEPDPIDDVETTINPPEIVEIPDKKQPDWMD